MADDFNKLAVLIEANTKSYERAMAKLQSSTNAAFGKIERQAKQLDSSFARMGGTLARIGAGLAAGLSIGSAVKFADAFTRVENSLKVAGLAGSELADVQERLFQIAQKNGTSFESLAGLYGKLALSQSALGVSTSELVGFTDTIGTALRVSGVSAEQASGALLQLGQALGSGTVRAEEFNSILEGAPAIAQAAAAGLEEAGGSVAKLRAMVNEGTISSQAFFRAIEAGSAMLESRAANAANTTSQAMQRLENAITRFFGEADDATGASSGMAWALDGMTSALQDAADWLEQNRHKFRDWTDDVWDAYQAIEQWAQKVRDASGIPALVDRGIQASRELLYGPENPYPANINRKGMGGRVFDGNRNRINQAFEDARGQRKVSLADFPGLSSGSSTSATSFDQVAKAASKATTETRQFENVIEAVEEKTNATADALSGFASSFAGDMMRGVSATEALANSLGSLADRLMSAGLDALISGLAGGFGGGGGYFGKSGFTNFLPFGGPRAMGGPVSPGKAYLVGERGPELFVPSAAGKVASNQNSMGGGNTVINMDLRGAQAGVEVEVRRALNEYSRGEYARTVAHVQQARKRRAI
jgi:tape measure domain-containing protein